MPSQIHLPPLPAQSTSPSGSSSVRTTAFELGAYPSWSSVTSQRKSIACSTRHQSSPSPSPCHVPSPSLCLTPALSPSPSTSTESSLPPSFPPSLPPSSLRLSPSPSPSPSPIALLLYSVQPAPLQQYPGRRKGRLPWPTVCCLPSTRDLDSLCKRNGYAVMPICRDSRGSTRGPARRGCWPALCPSSSTSRCPRATAKPRPCGRRFRRSKTRELRRRSFSRSAQSARVSAQSCASTWPTRASVTSPL